MSDKRYRYSIYTKPIIRPVHFVYFAKVSRMFDGKNQVDVTEDFGETWGNTKSEAHGKMTERVKAWIAAQDP